jgi:UDP-glucose:glycoprotein glucosyltransferase
LDLLTFKHRSCRETAALEKPDKFFELLDVITDPDRGLSYLATTDQALHEAVFQLARDSGFLLEVGSEQSTRRALALHVASPKVEAFYHHYKDREWATPPEGYTESSCSSWVDWYGRRVCDVTTLHHLVTAGMIESTNNANDPTTSVCIYFSPRITVSIKILIQTT